MYCLALRYKDPILATTALDQNGSQEDAGAFIKQSLTESSDVRASCKVPGVSTGRNSESIIDNISFHFQSKQTITTFLFHVYLLTLFSKHISTYYPMSSILSILQILAHFILLIT